MSTARALLVLLCLTASGTAHAQIKPRFVIAVDTSGSMLEDLSNRTTYGDGVGRPTQVGDAPALVKDGVFYGCGTTAGLDRNCDGLPNDSKIAVAKDAIRKMILGFGDVDWSLARFHQTQMADAATGRYNNGSNCTTATSAHYYGNPQCNTGGNGAGCISTIPMACRPGQGTNPILKNFANGNFTAKINYVSTGCPTTADLLVGFPGASPFTTTDNRPAILKWMDNVETSFDTSATLGNYCSHATSGDCELRPNGSTPIGSLIRTSGDYVATSRGTDTSASCRQYSIILLTDGTESCVTDTSMAAHPRNVAHSLAFPSQAGNCDLNGIPTSGSDIKTYVIGISTSATDTTALDAIAKCGGTTSAYPANTPAQLSAALSDIVSKSIPVEVCNGKDDDCDTKVDEGIPTGQPGSASQTGALFCDEGGKRSATQNDQVRLRPDFSDTLPQTTPVTQSVVCGRVIDDCTSAGVDDDCDGAIDEDGNLNTCGTCPGATDVCDGLDNDCDGKIDETPGSGINFSVCPTPCTLDVPCGSSVGTCVQGVYKCTGGILNVSACMGAVGPQPEICDQLDNDCNGVVDDPSVLGRVCTTPYGSVGICIPGMQYCAAQGQTADTSGYRVDSQGRPVCLGQVGPEDREICDLLDHDCDGDPFTCTQTTCVIKPNPEHAGDACGQGVGSCIGMLVCDETANPPRLVCNAPGGSPEICDNLDNDCDGKVDEGLSSGAACGSSIGECRPGTEVCAANGQVTCSGNVDAMDETCDGLDNDCDGKVDEGLALGETCGTDEGRCQSGKNVCSNGRTICSGEVGPQVETCDCEDNDCDGKIDEDTGSDPVCPGKSVCTMCQCALPCVASVEFAAVCPQGKAPITEHDECYCVGERCKDTTCRRQSITQNDELQCAPNSTSVGACQCKNNECSFVCAGVACGDGLICDPTDGRCKQSSCLLPQFACSDTQRCGLLDGVFQCIDDPCAFQVCDQGEACRDGGCVRSCARVTCPSGQKCADGECSVDKCVGVTCENMETCSPETGACVFAGLCSRVGCPDGNTCDAVSGTCSEDVCLRTECATDERCNSATGQCELRCTGSSLFCAGECVNPAADRRHCGATGNCSGDGAGEVCGDGLVCSQAACAEGCAAGLLNCGGDCINPANDPEHCGAAGNCSGSGTGQSCLAGETCTAGRCRTPTTGGETPEPTPGRSVVAAGGGGCACSIGPGSGAEGLAGGTGTSSRSLASLWLGLGLLGVLLRRRRSRERRRLGVAPSGGVCSRQASSALLLGLAIASTAVLDSGCKVSGFCLNCDENDAGSTVTPEIDSGISGGQPDAQVSVPDTGAPLDADAAMSSFDGGLNQPDACVSLELCNGIDDDCDGTVDEDADPTASNIDIQTNASHCGGCGKACAIEHAFNKCADAKCEIDRAQGADGCDVGYVDLDGDATNGCEYRCSKTAPDDTSCNQQDNDCDGKVDEDVDLNNDAANCGRCNLKCIFANASAGATCADKACGLDATQCDTGFIDADGKATTGCEYKCPVQPQTEEVCNALDDDCDGAIDEAVTNAADPRIDVDCGSMVGECKMGKTTCVNGAPVCTGSINPVLELCDDKDNDCDSKIDEGYDLQTDLGNCGSCGDKCLFTDGVNGHATLVCQPNQAQLGECKVGACIGNFANSNGDYHDGCENACTITGQEVCDNVDNDCNGLIDDNVTMPQFVCSSYEKGVCNANLTVRDSLRANGPRCMGGVISCNPSAASIPDYQANETLCDSKDNDCDGKVDEMTPAVGQPCSAGIGACKANGMNVCSGSPPGYACNVVANTGASTAEICDGLDNNCNGMVDDFAPPTTGNTVGNFNVVNLGASNVLIMQYEASRGDATNVVEGTASGKPCSINDKLPWANVTWGEASAACCALNANGQCDAGLQGWRLCDSATWQTACQGTSGACTWGYSDTGAAPCSHANVTTYQSVCLGSEYANTCAGGATQCATTTGNTTDFAQCRSVLAGGEVFDMSGNLKEWTQTAQSTGIYEQRGGSFNNIENGRTCAFNFTVGNTSFRFPTTGFRCCYYP